MKKTRKAARRAVSRRPKRARRQYFDTKRNLQDPILRAKWNNRKSPQANLAAFSVGDFEDKLADDEELKQKTPEKKLNEMETKIIHNLIQKHKDDYTRMSRDTRINVYQWTAAKCRKLANSFSRAHCCVASHKYLCHLIPTGRNQQQQQQGQQQQEQQQQQQQQQQQEQREQHGQTANEAAGASKKKPAAAAAAAAGKGREKKAKRKSGPS
ncbi:hypothetical protein Efla_005257 [Eimeria flavescens]